MLLYMWKGGEQREKLGIQYHVKENLSLTRGPFLFLFWGFKVFGHVYKTVIQNNSDTSRRNTSIVALPKTIQ